MEKKQNKSMWTAEQLHAIEEKGSGIIVPAAAGSGKTTVLVERTVRLLADVSGTLPAEKLLAVTFMKEAAAQMKSKLRAALTKKIIEADDPAAREWLSRQQDMLALARICTIDSFCYDMVRENLNETEYRNGLGIADDSQMTVLLDECVHTVLETMRRDCPDREELLVDALVKNIDGDTDNALGNCVKQLYEFKRSLPFPDVWAKKAAELFSDEDFLNEQLDEIFDKIKADTETALAYLEEALSLTGSLPAPDDILERLVDQRDTFDDVRTALTQRDYKKLYSAVGKDFPKPPAAGLTKLKNDDKPEQKRIHGKIDPLSKAAKALFDGMGDMLEPFGNDIRENSRIAGMVFSALDLAADMLDDLMTARKTEMGVAEFGDIERMAMRLLVENVDGVVKRTEFAERLRAEDKYRMLLIDEFQDVNDLQELIFRSLSDTDDLSMLGKNVFVVGDIKQSIYRFRQSNPELFKNAVTAAKDSANTQLTEIRLTKNFRSRQGVLAFVNAVFRRIMSSDIGELEYDADEQLYCGAILEKDDEQGEDTLLSGEKYPRLYKGSKFVGADCPAEIMLINEDENIADELKYMVFGGEELAVAQRIKQLIDEGAPVTEKGRQRPCRQSDFCILSRKTEPLRAAAAALEYVGLTAHTETGVGYMQSQEIIAILSLLKVIDNPNRSLELAAVMLSPIMGFTADELARLRMYCFETNDKGQTFESRRLYQVLLAVTKNAKPDAPDLVDEEDSNKNKKLDIGDKALEDRCVRTVNQIEQLRFFSVSMGIEELITYIYDKTEFFSASSCFEDSDRRRANLRMLTQRAAEYEANSTGGIAGFLRFLDSLTAAKGDFKQAQTRTSGSDSVLLKTFHRSKGLEFKFVFIIGLGNEFNLRDRSRPVLLSEKLYAGIRFYRHDDLSTVDTLSHMKLSDKLMKEMLSEEMRLLYVALTRAEERLFIPIFLKRNKRSSYDVPDRLARLADAIADAGRVTTEILADNNCRSANTWIAAALMLTEGCDPLLDAVNVTAETADTLHRLIPADDISPEIVYRTYPDENASQRRVISFAKALPDEQTADIIAKRLKDAEKARKAKALDDSEPLAASKRTVTEIVTEMNMKKPAPEDIKAMFYPQLGTLEKEELSKLSPAQRGTCTHLFMELADYSNCEKSVEQELERLVKRGSMTVQESRGVYVSAVKKFFSSELYTRMKAAGSAVMREKHFTVKASDAGIGGEYSKYLAPDGMLQGICDCIFPEGDGYVLVDYKTDYFQSEEELAHYDVQLELYKKALDIILPMPVKSCCLYSFALTKLIERETK